MVYLQMKFRLGWLALPIVRSRYGGRVPVPIAVVSVCSYGRTETGATRRPRRRGRSVA